MGLWSLLNALKPCQWVVNGLGAHRDLVETSFMFEAPSHSLLASEKYQPGSPRDAEMHSQLRGRHVRSIVNYKLHLPVQIPIPDSGGKSELLDFDLGVAYCVKPVGEFAACSVYTFTSGPTTTVPPAFPPLARYY